MLMGGYEFRLLKTPLPADGRLGLEDLLGHKGDPWMEDIRWRMGHAGGDLFAVACADGRAVANCWLGRSARCPGVAVLGHVFTAQEHRRRGLAGRLLKMVLDEFSRAEGRWVLLGAGDPTAIRLYERAGFGPLMAGPNEGDLTMLRPADPAALRAEYAGRPKDWTVDILEREHYPSACLLLCATGGNMKLPSCGIDRGTEAEERLLDALDARDRGEHGLYAMVEGGSRRVRAIACAAEGRLELYTPGLGEDDAGAFREAAAATWAEDA
jgi:GNAT superfamily N-acetyltransferase